MKNFFHKISEKIFWLLQLIKNQSVKLRHQIHPLPRWKQKRIIIPVLAGVIILIVTIALLLAKQTPTHQYDTLAQFVPNTAKLYIHWNKNLTPPVLAKKSWDKEILNYVWPEDLRPKNLTLSKDFSSLINSEVATAILEPSKDNTTLVWLARVDDKQKFQNYLDSNELPKKSDDKTTGTHYLWLDDNVIVLSDSIESLNLVEQTAENSLLKKISKNQLNTPTLFSLLTYGDWLSSYYSNSKNPTLKLMAQEIKDSQLITLYAQPFDGTMLKILGSIAKNNQDVEDFQSPELSWLPADTLLYAQGHWLKALLTLLGQDKDSSWNKIKGELSIWYEIDWQNELNPLISQPWSIVVLPRNSEAGVWPWIALANQEQTDLNSQNKIIQLAENYFARNYAKEVEKELPDGSKATELVADPAQVKWTDVEWLENSAKISFLKQGTEEFIWGNIAKNWLILANSLANTRLLLDANQTKQGINLSNLGQNCWQKADPTEKIYLTNITDFGFGSLLLGIEDEENQSNVYACLNF